MSSTQGIRCIQSTDCPHGKSTLSLSCVFAVPRFQISTLKAELGDLDKVRLCTSDEAQTNFSHASAPSAVTMRSGLFF
eukprot:4047923-Pleurochrysis_carterae.AAC.1